MLKRIVPKEATELLRSIFAFINEMDVMTVEEENFGGAVLDIAGKQKITYYDAAYLIGAKRSDKILVTEDTNHAEAAEKEGLKTLSIQKVHQNRSQD